MLSLQVGLASIVASVQRSGGTVNHPGQNLDEALEDLGAGIEMQAVHDNAPLPLSSTFVDAPLSSNMHFFPAAVTALGLC